MLTSILLLPNFTFLFLSSTFISLILTTTIIQCIKYFNNITKKRNTTFEKYQLMSDYYIGECIIDTDSNNEFIQNKAIDTFTANMMDYYNSPFAYSFDNRVYFVLNRERNGTYMFDYSNI